jgi:hypothetical protein
MTTIALQQELIDKISQIKNKKTLTVIKKYVELDCEIFHTNGALRLTPEMLQLLDKSEKQLENGQFKYHEQVMQEAKQWLNENK